MAFFGMGLLDDIAEARSGGMLSAPQAPAGMLGSSLADQLRAQWGGDWNISGIDRANELAGILQSKGVTSLDGLKMGSSGRREIGGDFGYNEGGSPVQAPDGYVQEYADNTYLDFGGTRIGNFGDRGKGSAMDFSNAYGPHANEFGWSSAGDGAVGYSAVTGADGKVQIVPNWNSSSDAAEARDLALKLATVAAGGLLGPGGFAGELGSVGSGMVKGFIGNTLTGGDWNGAVKGALTGGALGGITGALSGPAPGNGAFLGEGVSSGIPEWDAAFGGGPMGQAPISGIPPFNAADFEASLSQMTPPSPSSLPMPDFAQASMPGFTDIPGIQLSPQELQIPQLQMPSPASLLPDLSGYSVPIPSPQKPTTYEQLRADEKANMGQTAGNIPKTVNMGTFDNPAFAGGTMATAGGLTGAANVAAQNLADATASSQVGGSSLSQAGQTANNLMGQAGGALGTAAQWMKDNPLLGKLLMSGGMGLLSSGAIGGGGSSGAAQQDYGPAKQWGSPLQQGLLGQVQQTMPAAIQQRPAGLLAQGNANSGAWRFLGG